MRVIAIDTEQHYSGILLPDLDAVKKALYAYADGVSSASNATRQQQPDFTRMMLGLVEPVGNRFVDDLYEQIEASLSSRDEFYKDYDYDGAGRFLKTSVDVKTVPEGYVISFNAAYVGNKAEADIASYLGASRGLYWSKVNLTFDAAQHRQFAIDFQPIVDALAEGGLVQHSAKEVASIIAAGYKEEWSSLIQKAGTVQLFEQDSFAGSLYIDSITVGSYYESPFVAYKSAVAGQLTDRWGNEGNFENPRVTIMIRTSTGKHGPILDLDVQAEMLRITDNIRSRLAHLVEETADASV